MVCFLLGLALAATLPPSPLGPLAPLPLAPLLRWGGFRVGMWAGLGFWTLHLVWLPWSFADLFGPWGIVPFIPLTLIKGAMWGAVFGLTAGRPLARAGGWVVLEYLTSLGELAFPWGFLGYSLVDAPGRWLAALGGVYLLSLVVLWVAYGLGRRQYWAAIPWVMLWLIPLPLAQPTQTALLVQGNINPLRKVAGTVPDEQIYLNLTRQGLALHPQAGLVVWPETAVSAFPPELPAVLGGRELVSGFNAEGGYNRVVRYQDAQILETYDKNRLAPFGEFFPWQRQLGPVYSFFFRVFGFGYDLASRPFGSGYRTLGPYGAHICYESVFPGVARALTLGGARVLVLGSNDAWFGPSFGALQHFQMGRLRAVENGRWLLRAGNDGVTASIDPYGRVVARMPQHVAGYLAAPYALASGQTLYSRLGDWAVLIALGLLMLIRAPRVRRLTWRERNWGDVTVPR
ncbi:MAG: apolipoprotein N-acyltransferase [Meiothermus sp.]